MRRRTMLTLRRRRVTYHGFRYTTRSTNSPVNADTVTGLATNDLVLAFCFASAGGTWSAPTGWTQEATDTASAVFSRIVGSSPGSDGLTYAFGFSNPSLANMRVVLVRLSGAHLTNPVTAVSTATGTGSNQVVAGVTATYPDTTLFNFLGHISSTAAVTEPSGTTPAFNDGTGIRKVGATEQVNQGATGSRTWTNGTNGRLAALVAIRPA